MKWIKSNDLISIPIKWTNYSKLMEQLNRRNGIAIGPLEALTVDTQ